MKNIPEKIISIVIHPLLIPSYITIFIFYLPSLLQLQIPFSYQKAIFIIIFLMTFIAPTISIIIMKSSKIINSYTLENQKERFYPYASITSFYLATYIILYKYNIHPFITLIILLSAVSSLITLLINLKIKISAHTVSLGTALSYGVYFLSKAELNPFFFIITIIAISSLTAYSRLKLNAHKPNEVYLGLLVGISSGFFLFLIY